MFYVFRILLNETFKSASIYFFLGQTEDKVKLVYCWFLYWELNVSVKGDYKYLFHFLHFSFHFIIFHRFVLVCHINPSKICKYIKFLKWQNMSKVQRVFSKSLFFFNFLFSISQ